MRTRIWKLTALMLALLLTLTGCNLIEIDKEKDNSETVALVNGEKITKGEVANAYAYSQNYYSSLYYYYYGTSDINSQLDNIKDEVLETFIERKILEQKAVELGLDQLSDEDVATITAQATDDLEGYITDYAEDVDTEGMSEEEAHDAVLTYLADNGLMLDALIEDGTKTFIAERVRDSVITDVAIDDSAIEEAYEKEISDDETSFSASTYLYEMYRANGTTVYWNPEGYRSVKHVLLKMTDEQSAAYTALTKELAEVEASITALEADEDKTKAEAVEDELSNTDDDAEKPLSLEELNAKKTQLEGDIEEKKNEIIASFSDKTDAIYAALEAGTSFDDVMAEYGEDPGMQSDPNMTTGYFVSASSTYWDKVFSEAAMSLKKVGDVSEPVLGSSGVHIVYYNDDVNAGAVSLDEVREELSESLLESKQQEVYTAKYQEWYDAAKVKKYPKKMG